MKGSGQIMRWAIKHVRTGKVDRLRQLLQKNPRLLVEKTSSLLSPTLLHVAAHANAVESARCLLELGADPYAEDLAGQTPAMHCMLRDLSNMARFGSSQPMLELLGEQFAGPYPWLHRAICQRDADLVAYILHFGPARDQRVLMDDFVGTPVQLAVHLLNTSPGRTTRAHKIDPLLRICYLLSRQKL